MKVYVVTEAWSFDIHTDTLSSLPKYSPGRRTIAAFKNKADAIARLQAAADVFRREKPERADCTLADRADYFDAGWDGYVDDNYYIVEIEEIEVQE